MGAVFAEFEKERKINTDAIADMAIENFTRRWRIGSGDARFLFRKEGGTGAGSKISAALRAKVCDGDLPSCSLLRRAWLAARVQDRMLAELCEPINRVEDLDWDKADRLIRRELAPLEIPQ